MLLDRENRRRLAELSRKGATGPTQAPAVAAPEPAAAPDPRPALQVGWADDSNGPLAELLPGEARTVAEGVYWELSTPVSAYGPWAEESVARYLAALADGRLPGACQGMGHLTAETIVFMDTETTGLNNEPLFLVGLLSVGGGEAAVVQLLARDYAEEPAVLAEAMRRLQASGLVVTYNGTTFDLPYIRNRLRYHRLAAPRVDRHVDLLKTARACLGRSLGNCRLQTLERHYCGRERAGDIPGGEIPQAYHDFVASGDAGCILKIARHNGMDMIALAELLGHLAEAEKGRGT